MAYNPEVRRKSYLKMRDRALAYSAEYNLKRKFNLTQEQYSQMLQKQSNVCAICKGTGTRKLAVDHDHKTGKIRGLLCTNCNRALGYFKDSAEILSAARAYINSEGLKRYGFDWYPSFGGTGQH